jgi:hypothetical protein
MLKGSDKNTRLAMDPKERLLSLELALSFGILSESLSDIIYGFYGEFAGIHLDLSCEDMINDGMRQGNWCMARYKPLQQQGLIMGYVASLLPSYERVPRHHCDVWGCQLRTTSLDQIHAVHTKDCCGACGDFCVEDSDLLMIIESGDNPGISGVGNEMDGVCYQTVGTKGKDYVAISHVWSHGLCNPSRNSLPHCQMLRLFRLIRQVGNANSILWIDTISVPVEPRSKQLAVDLMRGVYRESTKKLVLDRYLQRVGEVWLERRLQLRASDWMKDSRHSRKGDWHPKCFTIQG